MSDKYDTKNRKLCGLRFFSNKNIFNVLFLLEWKGVNNVKKFINQFC